MARELHELPRIGATSNEKFLRGPLGEGGLYAAQIGDVGFHLFPGEGAVP